MIARAPSLPPPARVRVVGCGRSHRCDDQLGLRVAELLAATAPSDVAITVSESPGADLLCDLAGVELLIVVDAAAAHGTLPPGAWRRVVLRGAAAEDAPGQIAEWRGGLPDSSHLLGVADALRLGAELNLLPDETWIYVVAAEQFGYGAALSPAVAIAVPQLAEALQTELAAWRRRQVVSHA